MADGFWDVSTNCLVTAELMKSELNLPLVYLDTDAVSEDCMLILIEQYRKSGNFQVAKISLFLDDRGVNHIKYLISVYKDLQNSENSENFPHLKISTFKVYHHTADMNNIIMLT